MKKILFICGAIMVFGNAHASSLIPLTQEEMIYIKGHTAGYNKGYNNGYNRGYQKAKVKARERVFKTTGIVVGTAIIGTLIYQLGRESRWTATENGITYRF